MEKRTTQPDSTGKLFPYKPNHQTLNCTFTTTTNYKSQKPSEESHPKTQAHQKEKKRKEKKRKT